MWPLWIFVLPVKLPAADGSSISYSDAAFATLVVAAITGWLVWLANRRARKETEVRAAGTVQQITSLIEHADCLLWEARVESRGDDWKWEFTLHPSVLSRKLFGGKLPEPELGLWYKFKIPQQAEMDRTSRDAMAAGRSGYEQQFQLEFEGRALWLRETVSITSVGTRTFRLVGLAVDITAQRQAELTNLASQEQLQQLLAHANCMLWQSDVTRNPDGGFHWEWFVPRSELHRRLMGGNADEKAIMPWGILNVPEFPEIEARSRNAMMTGLPGYEQVFGVVQGDRLSWMHEQAAITHLGKDRWKIQGVVMDITAQRQAEEARRTSDLRLQHLLERADCTVWQAKVTKDAADELDWAVFIPPSQLYRRIYGTATINPEGFEWKKLRVPEYDEMKRVSRNAVLGNASGYEQVFRVPRPGGDLWLSEQVSIVSSGPDTWDLVGIITDITARYEAEEARRTSEAQLQQVLELANCLVWHATVSLRPDNTYDWSLKTQRSVLYRKLFGEDNKGTALDWRKLNVSEIGEMDERFMKAFREKSPGYENVFRVVSHLKVTWLHETITLRYLPSGEAHLVGVITDVTLQREALEARRASEIQVQQMLATADCMLWQARVFTLPDGNVSWVMLIPPSRLHREVFGGDPPNPPVLMWTDVIDAATYKEINLRSTKALRSGAPGYEQEFHAQRGNRIFWLHEQVAITCVGPGEWRLVGVITDLSARREAEQSVRASEIRYRSLFQHTPVAIVETDFRAVGSRLSELRQSGVANLTAWLDEDPRRLHDCAKRVRVSNTNETAMRMLRAKSPGDFRRRRSVLATPGSLNAIRETLLALWEGRNTLEAQLEMHDFEGGVHFMNVRWWVAQTDAGLDLSQSLLVFVDLTELKQAEAALATEKERLAVTLRAMAEGVVTTDVAGIVQFINPAAATLTQWDADAVGQPVGRICTFENDGAGDVFEFPLGRIVQSDSVVDLPPQTRLITRNGQRRLVDGCCAPIHSADSEVIGMVFVFRDVTEHERLEQELVRATRLESVGILAGGIAHDFNNILTGVMGNLALAQLDIEAKSEAGERLREAEKATLRARDLTQQLLTFAKGGEPVRAAVQLSAMVRETATFALHGSNVKPLFHLPANLWPADADKGQIDRVVQNLVINAIQAMPNGGTLRLTAQNEKISGLNHPGLVPGYYVQIEVADTGEGIKPEHLPRIFDPYFTTKQTGSGLGLAAVYSIIKKHRGHVDVESAVGQGTTFRIWLPAIYDAVVDTTTPPMPLSPGKFSGRVLFMDDEEVIRRMAVLMLQRLGFEVECAIDGAEAVAKFRKARAEKNPFALVIMDLTVPGGMGGREAIVQLRGIDPEVKAIVSSGYSSDPVLANYRAHGFCGVVAKPYRLDDFIHALREALVERRG
ncbi:MAG TPA: ATP-binding protein [Lacunisphaera sp.]